MCFVRISKKFLLILFMAAILICVAGCGSDKDDKSDVDIPNQQRTTTPTVESPPPVSKPSVKLYHSDLAITADQFVALYNAALEEFANQNGTNFNERKLTFDNPKNVERTKSGGINFYSGKYCTVSVFKNNPSAPNICGVSFIAKAGRNTLDCLPEITAGIFAATQSGQDFSDVINFVDAPVRARKPFATEIDGLLIYYNAEKMLAIIVDDSTADDGFGNRIADNFKDTATKHNLWLKYQGEKVIQREEAQRNNQSPPPASNQSADKKDSGLSLGGVGIGDPVEKMRNILGREDRTTQPESNNPTDVNAEYKDIVVTHNGRRVTALISYSPAVKTERNIHEGSSLQEVINAYGRRCAVQNYEDMTLYEYPYDTPQGFVVMRFAVKNNVVNYISLRIVSNDKDRREILSAVKTL